tara:strand:- start:516 stop:1301 length:786 start_codon:yes stop_codon:yes gene_type:complete
MKNIKSDKIFPFKDSKYFISLLTINREKSLNSVNTEVIDELIASLNLFRDDRFCKAIILTGSGDKAFIAGADIKLMSKMDPDEAYEYSLSGHRLCNNISNFNKPVIAAVNGYALGGGCEIALSCHMRYASPNAFFAQPEVSLGIIAGWGGTQRLTKTIGPTKAFEMLTLGNRISAEKALGIGLVNDVFEEKLIDNIVKKIILLFNNSSNAVSKTIDSINNFYNMKESDALKKEQVYFKESFEHEDSKIGLFSFIERKKPNF